MSLSCDHKQSHKPTKAAVRQAIRSAKARSLEANQRWTTQRERVFELLVEAGAPVKAYDLMAQFKEGAPAAPPTVYRALDALVAIGVVHRIAGLNAYAACGRDEVGHTASFLICDCCGAAEEIADLAGDVRHRIETDTSFRPASVSVEAHGLCARCQA